MYQEANDKIKYFLYARKSQESEDRQIQSLDDQINVLVDFAKRNNLKIVEVLTESKSAKTPNQRPVFSEMLSRIERNEAQGILCWQINRLSRNPIESGTLSWMLQQGTLQCIQTADRKYLPDDNVLLFSVESGMANQYIIDLRKNCKRGMEGKASRGWFPSRPPIGYLNEPTGDRRIIIDPDRYTIVRKMWELMLTGAYNPEQVGEIACGESGLRTRKSKRRGGVNMAKSSLHSLFNNVFYTGAFEWKGKLYPGNHHPMITMSEYEQVQAILRRKERSCPKTHDFAFTGLIRCASCGAQYTATKRRKFVISRNEYREYIYYHCTRKKKGVACDTRTQKPVTQAEIEFALFEELSKSTFQPEVLDWGFKLLEKEFVKSGVDKIKVRESIISALSHAEKELDNLTRMLYRELIEEEAFIKERDQLRTKIVKFQTQLQEKFDPEEEFGLLKRAFAFTTNAVLILKTGTEKERKIAMNNFGSNYSMNGKKLLFDKPKWLIPIEENRDMLQSLFSRLELEKTFTTKGQNAPFEAFSTLWWATLDEVRTEIDHKFFIPRNIDLPDFGNHSPKS